MGATGKIIGVAIALLVFSTLAGTVLTNLGSINTTGFDDAGVIVPVIGLMFFLGVGVILVLKELGVISGI